eukprot:gene11271-12570_t
MHRVKSSSIVLIIVILSVLLIAIWTWLHFSHFPDQQDEHVFSILSDKQISSTKVSSFGQEQLQGKSSQRIFMRGWTKSTTSEESTHLNSLDQRTLLSTNNSEELSNNTNTIADPAPPVNPSREDMEQTGFSQDHINKVLKEDSLPTTANNEALSKTSSLPTQTPTAMPTTSSITNKTIDLPQSTKEVPPLPVQATLFSTVVDGTGVKEAFQSLQLLAGPVVTNTLNKIYDDAETINKNELVTRFHRIMRTGLVKDKRDSNLMPSFPLALARVKEVIRDLCVTMSVELTSLAPSCSLTAGLAKDIIGLASVIYHFPTTRADRLSKSSTRSDNVCLRDVGNQHQSIVLASGKDSILSKALVEESVVKTLNCMQYIDDLSLLQDDLLPFEYEYSLGKLLARCRVTIFSDTLPASPFFTSWENTEILAKAAYGAFAHISNYSHSISTVYNSFVQVTHDGNEDFNTTKLSWADIRDLPLDLTSRRKLASQLIAFTTKESIYNHGGRDTLQSLSWIGERLETPVSGSGIVSSVEGSPPLVLPAARYDSSYTNPSTVTISLSSTQLPQNGSVAVGVNSTIAREEVGSDRRVLTVTTSSSRTSSLRGDSTKEFLGPDPSTRSMMGGSLDSSHDEDQRLLAVYRHLITGEFELKETEVKKSISPKSTKYHLSSSSRAAQRKLIENERVVYKRWMTLLTNSKVGESNELSIMRLILKSQRVFVMGEQSSLLGLKLAKLLVLKNTPESTTNQPIVVSVLLNGVVAEVHYKLSKSMNVMNNVITTPSPSLLTHLALSTLPEHGDVSLIMSDLIVFLLEAYNSLSSTSEYAKSSCDTDWLVESLAVYLQISSKTVIQLPSLSVFLEIIHVMTPQCETSFAQLYSEPVQFLMAAIKATSVSASIKQLDSSDEMPLTFIVILHGQDESHHHDSIASPISSFSGDGFSLRALTSLDIIPEQRKLLMHLLVNLPFWSYADVLDISEVSSNNLRLRIASDGAWTLGLGGEEKYDSFSEEVLLHQYREDKEVWKIVGEELQSHPAELANGRFSFVVHDSRLGIFPVLLSQSYPNATILCMERRSDWANVHVKIADILNVENNAVCVKTSSNLDIYHNFHDSPELFRFQLLHEGLWESFLESDDVSQWGEGVSHILSSALTSFIRIPNTAVISWALSILYGEVLLPSDHSNGDVLTLLHSPMALMDVHFNAKGLELSALNNMTQLMLLDKLGNHPQTAYASFGVDWLMFATKTANAEDSVSVLLSPLHHHKQQQQQQQHDAKPYESSTFVRCDIVNMTRHVKHHYQSDMDGHKRTYTMHIELNYSATASTYSQIGDPSTANYIASSDGSQQVMLQRPLLSNDHNDTFSDNGVTQPIERRDGEMMLLPLGHHANQHSIVAVHLLRDRDSWPIPYSTIYGITLISALRLGLHDSQRDRLFKAFLRMPLYEDMAPWNIVLMGQSVDYIDYDSKDVTFDLDVPKAYRIMSVLMNYKRTVQDFMKCGRSSSTVYGLPFIADCVSQNRMGSDVKFSCPDLRRPVPCGDGHCHSDYISCLRSLSQMADSVSESPSISHDNVRGNSRYHTHPSEDVYEAQFVHSLAQAMSSVVSSFNHSGSTTISYADFLKVLGRTTNSLSNN